MQKYTATPVLGTIPFLLGPFGEPPGHGRVAGAPDRLGAEPRRATQLGGTGQLREGEPHEIGWSTFFSSVCALLSSLKAPPTAVSERSPLHSVWNVPSWSTRR